MGCGAVHERLLRPIDACLPLGLENVLPSLPRRFGGRKFGGEGGVIGRDLLAGPLHRGHLLRPARPIEDAEKDFIDESVVVGLAGDEFGQFAPRIGEDIADGRATDQCHHRPEGHAAGHDTATPVVAHSRYGVTTRSSK